ncbi:DUF4142 domain-containing protein [Aporhodopirellula aestuarii]|uniref:DUF4142 domain-containing protein n=1 Tax=Aporhodopirellula aestuarii TaxID=2950107 RepID=A0ABT0TXZ7_9BACT|nr:DUF4142 domain-containing protein [Aporhodopirellula aestuarii]MCM2369249.1 DUF4142 domain-containing protein [Aporhodopirellula aestuarii]
MSLTQWKIAWIAAPLSLALLAPVSAQGVNVQVGQADVGLNREGASVEVDVDEVRLGSPGRSYADRMNQQIASWLLADQEALLDLTRYGLERSRDEHVRRIAQAMIRDHERIVDQLSPIAAWRTRPSWSRTSEEIERDQQRRLEVADEAREDRREIVRDARRDGDGVRRPLENIVDRIEDGVERVADRTEQAVENTRDTIDRELRPKERPRSRGVPWIAIHREVVDAVTETARQDLKERTGYEFEASFVGMLVASHIQQEATLKTLRSRATGELSETIEDVLAIVRQHRNEANRVMEVIQP